MSVCVDQTAMKDNLVPGGRLDMRPSAEDAPNKHDPQLGDFLHIIEEYCGSLHTVAI